MTTDPLDDYIDAVSKALGLSIADAWKPAVRANLEISLRFAGLVDEFALSGRSRAGQCLCSLISP